MAERNEPGLLNESSMDEQIVRVTGHSGNAPGQGPFMKVHFAVADGIISEATYETYQCPGCVACGKALCEMIRGASLETARAVKHPALVERVGPLPRHRQICYGLALLALSDALDQLKVA